MTERKGTRKKILISNNPELLAVLRESILQTSQVFPLVASNNEETISLIKHWSPDLLILGPDNINSLCNTIKNSTEMKDFREIPLIAVLAKKDEQLRQEALESGCDDWLQSPFEEKEILGKVQELIGLRFRKLPRYTFRDHATVSYKGKTFSCQSIDINRQMIFLQNQEDIAPATGRNVKLNFKLTEDETVQCWGRVERLMARKFMNDEKETIGMLIRFLDLPPSIARRIDNLALKQTKLANYQKANPKSDGKVEWLAIEFYEKLVKTALSEDASELVAKLTLPEFVFNAFISGLTEEEKNSFGSDSGNELMRTSIAHRIKMMDELNKLRKTGPSNQFKNTIQEALDLEKKVQGQLVDEVNNEKKEGILLWAKIKYEMIRTRLEIEALERLKSPFSQSLSNSDYSTEARETVKRVFLTVGLGVSLFLNVIVLVLFMTR